MWLATLNMSRRFLPTWLQPRFQTKSVPSLRKRYDGLGGLRLVVWCSETDIRRFLFCYFLGPSVKIPFTTGEFGGHRRAGCREIHVCEMRPRLETDPARSFFAEENVVGRDDICGASIGDCPS